MFKLATIFICFILIILTTWSSNLLLISEINLVFISIIILLDYLEKKTLSFFQVWLIAFIFIILSEALLVENPIEVIEAARYLIVSNIIVIFGYQFPLKHPKQKILLKNYKVNESKWTPLILFFIIVIYVLYSLPSALLANNHGRIAVARMMNNENLILSSFNKSLGLILPSLIVFYYKEIKKRKTLLIPTLISLPIFFILFLGGTRFYILFSLGGFIFLSQISNHGKIQLNSRVLILSISLLITSTLMLNFRTSGFSQFNTSNMDEKSEDRLSKKIATKMSPEGIIDMTSLSMNYFKNNPHTYGKSTAFLTYFWIPRSLWNDKPTMIGNWLLRTSRSGFSDGHSASFGFTGELYADFGYFSLFFIFFIGTILKWGDLLRERIFLQKNNYSKIIIVMGYPYVFFFVRSPITASITFIGVIIVYKLSKIILFR